MPFCGGACWGVDVVGVVVHFCDTGQGVGEVDGI